MMGRIGGGREKHRGAFNPRIEERGNGVNPRSHPLGQVEAQPSRHLWVGNLPPRVTQGMLLEQFLRFGDLETIAFVPGRSYAFVNFRRVEDAIFALRTLQGQMFAGLPLKIEFQKGDKLSANSSFEGGYGRDERNSADLGEPFLMRGPGPQSSSPGRAFLDNSQWISSEEPSEFLRIGFPIHLIIDRNDLERAFSPFGELDNVICYPTRGYAIVRYRSIVAACLAKDAMQGRLFNNPRIIISFAKIDSGPRDFENFPFPAPRFFPELENFPGERDAFPRSFDHPRFQNLPPPEDRVDRRFSPSVDPGLHHQPPWAADDRPFSSAKKLKTDSFPDRELPEYPFSSFDKERAPRLPERDLYSRSLVSEFGGKTAPDFPENDDLWRKPEGFPPSRPNPEKWRRSTPENQPIPVKEWKWEGTIAKGGTPICRARCFPVGKALDFMLPEFLDCTARTGLDMLSRHFYQASDSWVVFFVPDTDADIAFYNEFLHFLGEKNRAAVAKLEDKTTLFLIPPSEFSEKVLKVPGKLSISGVILRFQESSSDLDSAPAQSRPSVDESTLPRSSRPPLPSPREGAHFSSLPDPFAPAPRPYSAAQERIQRKQPLTEPAEETPAANEPGLDLASSSAKQQPPLLPEQLAQLASFLGQQKQASVQRPLTPAVSLSSQGQRPLVNAVRAAEPAVKLDSLGEPEGDPEKRLQATLQLAAALLQQIQHQSKPDS
ncbi:RNA recognition motif (RRM)-containing protein [Wolffia australiana]